MERKLKVVKRKSDELREQMQELEELAKMARQEEEEKMENARQQINQVCEEAEMFCGVILSPQDITAIVDLALKTRENVKIPFNLYFNE